VSERSSKSATAASAPVLGLGVDQVLDVVVLKLLLRDEVVIVEERDLRQILGRRWRLRACEPRDLLLRLLEVAGEVELHLERGDRASIGRAADLADEGVAPVHEGELRECEQHRQRV
jgi:hypothetical protein